MSEKIQLWYCEACNVEGVARLDPVEDVYGAIQKLSAAHDMASPDCLAGNLLRRLRIRGPECSDREWAEVTKDRKDIALPR
jgi:hypothetical protein